MQRFGGAAKEARIIPGFFCARFKVVGNMHRLRHPMHPIWPRPATGAPAHAF
ncbi:hypothetical protein BUH_5564 [Burkholderia pseudomallei Pakistan 9]|uniref:Uncharacterized protein n=1 Tax=Burkholderia pseudomallei 1710a TaxID=320371 RepID=A0A0E1VU18_BURPE|nr:hypothetical protein BUH_5564 [Burkholderia pseudomallei Pakistan 9]EET03614.1 hypothetical protein BURPS1710A_A0392 [Burkholderia pseudomallei 1710a]